MSHCVIVLCRRDFSHRPCTYTLQNPDGKEFSTSSRYVLESPTNYHILQEAATDAKVFFELLFINEIYVLDYLPCRSTERPTRTKRIVYLRAHQNGYLVVTGRNSFTYEDFYDIRDEEEVWGVRGEKENYSRPLFFIQWLTGTAPTFRPVLGYSSSFDPYLRDIIDDGACNLI